MSKLKLVIYHPFILLSSLLLFSCSGSLSGANKKTWKSPQHQLEVTYAHPWEVIHSVSSPKETIFGLIDNSDGKSYVIKIAQDVSQELLSDQDYISSIQGQMLSQDSHNRLILTGETPFHGQTYNHLVFIMHTKKWGVMAQHAFTLRSEGLAYSAQISYPVQSDVEAMNWPEALKELNDQILILGK